MKQALLYDRPEEFANMMKTHLEEGLRLRVRQEEGEPLLLRVDFGGADGEAQISLHDVFRTYQNTGDLNTAVDYLNGLVNSVHMCRSGQEEMLAIDTEAIYPALRETRYVEEAGQGFDLLAEAAVPGLSVIYLESKEGYSKLLNRGMIELHPRLTEERVKRIARRNLRSEGWAEPKLVLQSPFRKSCYTDVYMDYPHPAECQFLQGDWIAANMPQTFLIAFTNRNTTLVMRSTEDMSSPEAAAQLAKKSKFTDVVLRSCRIMPNPVSEQIYWVHRGEYHLLP